MHGISAEPDDYQLPPIGDDEADEILQAGTVHSGYTDGGQPIKVWKPPAPERLAIQEREKYFCHGLSFQTHQGTDPYSVLSDFALLVLQDEYTPIGGTKIAIRQFHCCPFSGQETEELEACFKQIGHLGVVAWHNPLKQSRVDHTARFDQSQLRIDKTVQSWSDWWYGRYTVNNINLGSKNGVRAPPRLGTLEQISSLYARKLHLTELSFWKKGTS